MRVSRGHDYEFSHHAAFDRLLKDGFEPMDIYHAICTQVRPAADLLDLFAAFVRYTGPSPKRYYIPVTTMPLFSTVFAAQRVLRCSRLCCETFLMAHPCHMITLLLTLSLHCQHIPSTRLAAAAPKFGPLRILYRYLDTHQLFLADPSNMFNLCKHVTLTCACHA